MEIDALQAEAEALYEKVVKNERLAAKSAVSEKVTKRVAAYERRAEAAKEAVRGLEERIRELHGKQEALRAEARRLEPVKRAVDAMDRFKAQQEEYQANQAMDVFKVEAVEEREVFQSKFNKHNPMADLGG